MNNNIKLQAKKAYEVARLKGAGLFSLLIIPLVALSYVTCGDKAFPLIIGLALLISVIYMKWRGLEYSKSVNFGLVAGVTAFVIPLVMHLFEICCRNNLEIAFCIGSGILGGVILGRTVSKSTGNYLKLSLFSLIIACLTATLGCASLGIAAVMGLMASLIFSTLTVRYFLKTLPK